MNIGNLPFVVAALLVVFGIYTFLFKRNLIKRLEALGLNVTVTEQEAA